MKGFSIPSFSMPKVSDVIKTNIDIPKMPNINEIKSSLNLPEMPKMPDLPPVEFPSMPKIDTSSFTKDMELPNINEISDSIQLPNDINIDVPEIKESDIPKIEMPDMSEITSKLDFFN